MCSEVFNLIKDLNNHVCSKNRRFRYNCGHCTRRFQHYVSCYKHQKTHLTAPHVCPTCRKGFWFPMNLAVHQRRHTGQGLFCCTNCPNQYTTHAAMDTHHLMHQGRKFTCAKCPYFNTDTAANLRQHQHGKHGKGWKHCVAKCTVCLPKCSTTRRNVTSVKTLKTKLRQGQKN